MREGNLVGRLACRCTLLNGAEDYLVRWVEQERLLLLKLGEAIRAVMQDRRAFALSACWFCGIMIRES